MYIKIKEARESAGLTQQQLADRLGISFATVSGYECGKHDPKSDTLVRISRICGVSVDWLLGYEPSNHKEQELCDVFRRLSPEGQDVVIEYAEMCAASPKYQKKSEQNLA